MHRKVGDKVDKSDKADQSISRIASQAKEMVRDTVVLAKATLPPQTHVRSGVSHQTKEPDDTTTIDAIIAEPLANDNQLESMEEPVDEKKDSLLAYAEPKPLPELLIKCKKIVAKEMEKHAAITQSSFETVVMRLLNSHQAAEQAMAIALEKQRLQYDEIVHNLRVENVQMHAKCDELNSKTIKLTDLNSQLATKANETKTGIDKLKADLETANGKYANLLSQFNEMLNENGALNKRVGEFEQMKEERSVVQEHMHQMLQQSMQQLNMVCGEMVSSSQELNKELNELKIKFNAKEGQIANMSTELNRLRAHNQWQTQRIQYLQNSFATMIRPFCERCRNPGVPYQCNRCRENINTTLKYFDRRIM